MLLPQQFQVSCDSFVSRAVPVSGPLKCQDRKQINQHAGNFGSLDGKLPLSSQELVLARVDCLELLQLRLKGATAGTRSVGDLQVVAAVPFAGKVTGLHAFRPFNSSFDYILGIFGNWNSSIHHRCTCLP